MKNYEKFLKVSVNEFFSAIMKSQIDISGFYSLEKWLLDEPKPTLSEDERVILRNIRERYKFIAKDSDLMLYIAEKSKQDISQGRNYVFGSCINTDLFQFIKERRRI